MAPLRSDPSERSGGDAGGGAAGDRPPPTPRWVKVFAVIGIIVLVLVLVIVVGNLAGFGGEHGPGRHTGPAEDPATSAGDHARPSDHHAPAAGERENADGVGALVHPSPYAPPRHGNPGIEPA